MPFTKAGQLTRSAPIARADDTLGLVAENMRSAPHGVLPILDRTIYTDETGGERTQTGRVIGLVYESDLARAVLNGLQSNVGVSSGTLEADEAVAATNGQALHFNSVNSVTTAEPAAISSSATAPLPDPFASSTAAPPSRNGYNAAQSNGAHSDGTQNGRLRGHSGLTARSVMRSDVGVVPAAFSLHNALLALDRYDSPALPVVDAMGNYQGMIMRADVVAALEHAVRPPLVGGMATPLGVWLTTGHINAGAPILGLFLSGAVIGLCFLVSRWLMLLGLTVINREWGAMFLAPGLEMAAPSGFVTFTSAGQYLLFLLMVRVLPLAGVHAAEHQTVWAIEKGLPLTPEHVEKMPRAHPRCGTNLMALSVLYMTIFPHLPVVTDVTVLLSLLLIFFVWRLFGKLLQEWFTTKPPTRKQLESGIAAGRELIAKYQEQPHMEASIGARLFNSGIIAVALGLIPTLLLSTVAEYFLMQWLLTM